MNVLILQPMLKEYRVSLFSEINYRLVHKGYNLRVVVGTPWDEESKRDDNVYIEADYLYFEKSHWLFSNKLHILKNVLKHIVWADIIITEQANKHSFNYLLILLSYLRIKRFAYWGHGQNRQGDPNSLGERLKKALLLKTDWWFAYTESVAEYVQECGYPKQKITILNNSVDTFQLTQAIGKLSNEEIKAFKENHNIADDAIVALFCGSLHKKKQVEFLLDSAILLQQKIPSFVLLIGGRGIDEKIVRQYAEKYSFIIYLNRLDGKLKYLAFKCSNIFMNPGMVGLAILDAFSAELPLFTTKHNFHSPEIDYLQHGFNGMISNENIEDYVMMIKSVLDSKQTLKELQANALASSKLFSIENMANEFCNGIDKLSADIKKH